MLHHVACHISMNPGRGVDWQFWNEVQYLGHVLIRALVFGQPSKQHLSSYQYGDNLCFRFPWWFPWVYSVVLVEPDDTIVSSTGFQLPGGCWWRGCLYVAISTNLCRRWDKLQRRSPRSWRGRDALLGCQMARRQGISFCVPTRAKGYVTVCPKFMNLQTLRDLFESSPDWSTCGSNPWSEV